MPLNLRVKTSTRIRITKNVSEGVVNVQIQCLSPWTWIDVSSTYRIGEPRILLKIASYSDRTASAARRIKSNMRLGFFCEADYPHIFVFSDDDRLRFGNFLDNLRLYSEWRAKLCSAIGASICCYFYLLIRRGIRSRYAFMPDFLTGLSLVVLILIFFAIAATS